MERRLRSQNLEMELQILCQLVPGITSAVLANNDGLLMTAYIQMGEVNGMNASDHSQQVSAMTATLMSLASKALERMANGQPRRLLIEGDAGTLVVYPAGRVTLSVLAMRGSDMARVLYATQRTARIIEQLMM